MTRKRTTTDVIITTYPARFGYPRARQTIDFSAKCWVVGSWTRRETLSRRRRWTVAREWLAERAGGEEYTETLRRTAPGLFLDSIDHEGKPRAILVRVGSGEAVVLFLEERKRG